MLCSAAGVSLLGALFRIWQLRQRLSFLKSSYDPRCIKTSFIMWQDSREFVFYLRLFGNSVAYQVAGCAIKSSAFTVSLPVPMTYHEVFYPLRALLSLTPCFSTALVFYTVYLGVLLCSQAHSWLVVYFSPSFVFIFLLSFFSFFSKLLVTSFSS